MQSVIARILSSSNTNSIKRTDQPENVMRTGMTEPHRGRDRLCLTSLWIIFDEKPENINHIFLVPFVYHFDFEVESAAKKNFMSVLCCERM